MALNKINKNMIQGLPEELNGLTEQLAQTATYAIDDIHHLKPTKLNVVDTGVENIRLRDMGKDGVVYAVQGHSIKRYNDLTDTWDQVLTAPLQPHLVLSLDNGELLFACRHVTTDDFSRVYVTKNNQTSFVEVLTSGKAGISFSNDFGKSTYGNIVLVSEYGTQGLAHKVYLSDDYGNTFREIFDLANYAPNPTTAHVHGVAYDPYWARIWIVNGDNPNNNIYWSDDMGVTWENTGTVNQLLNVMPMQNCILFGSDSVPYAIYRMDRGVKTDKPELKIAHIYAEDTYGHLSYFPKTIYKRDENSPVIINISPEKSSLAADGTYTDVWALATYDGYNFYEIFRGDPVSENNDTSMLCYLPTKNNKAVVTTANRRVLVGDSVTWSKGGFAYRTPVDEVRDSLDDVLVSVRDFGVRSVDEHPLLFQNNTSLALALEYCANNHKILHIPKDMEVTIGTITLENKNDFGIKIDGKLKLKTYNDVKGITLKNCKNVRIYDINGVFQDGDSVQPDERSVLTLEQCENIYFDNIIGENVRSNVLRIFNSKNIFGKLVKGTANDTGVNVLEIKNSSDVYIDELIIDGVGMVGKRGGLYVYTTGTTSVVSNINFKNIFIKSITERAVSIDNALNGRIEKIDLGNCYVEMHNNNTTVNYGMFLNKVKNVKGYVEIIGKTNQIRGFHVTDVDNVNLDIQISNVVTAIQQSGNMSNSKVTGLIDTCTYRALDVSNLNDVLFELKVGEVTGNQYSVNFSFSGNYTDVLFLNSKFRKGANVTGAVNFGGNAQNVEFRNCDLSEWGSELDKMIRCSQLSTVKRVNCLGMNFLAAIPSIGKWNVGEIVYNSNPTPGSYLGWVCTSAGTPGTWKGFGAIQA
ncbi:hypothetical protein M3649_04300 [Ureibacillus chungkukjangi]|uniref:hypothetical protein n=1 Tax=Ureibacillus chungkukjangi TaxID=1202712 RepID=UPI00203F4484|nr:hypothetical protein [Ureibacillus chungkukjangi]MCM3387355.1 hypothetical protein [Ureibacillus chungkukjangi]